MDKWITCAAVAVLFLSFNIAHAVSCNPKAQVHQQRLANIQMAVSFGQIPSADDEQFVLCMLPEKEDQQAFRRQVQQLKDQLRARQQQEAEQRRRAIIAHNRPQSPEEQASAQAQCAQLVQESGELRDAGVAYCLAAWKANPHSMCGGDNLPCGSADERLCYAPYAGQRCVNGQVTGNGAVAVAPWVENAPVQITKLADGIYTDEGMPCGRPGQRGVILIQGNTAQLWGGNTYRLVNTKQAGVLGALNNGTGDQGYNGQIIVSGSTLRWSGYGVEAQRPFRLCQEANTLSMPTRGDSEQRTMTPPTLVLDPRAGQNGQLVQIDRDQCDRWAMNQTGYGPTQPSSSQNYAQYQRAMSACLVGRGYGVKWSDNE
jgi:hypothetical protein